MAATKQKLNKLILIETILFLSSVVEGLDEGVFDGSSCRQDFQFQTVFKPQIREFFGDVGKIIEYTVQSNSTSGMTYKTLAEFVDRFGSRLTGTKNLENSIDFMIDRLKKEGHQNVHGEEVAIPRWTRGNEWALMVLPRLKKLNILGLGYSVGTGGQTIEAPVLVVRSFDELKQKADQVAGKIVVYNFVFESYGKQAQYRGKGASKAAKYGAVAAMIRSLTPFSINSPHTGMQSYDQNVTKIPAISITTEDADLFQRISNRGEKIVVQIYSENHLDEKLASSRNTISEIVGETSPDEIVLVSGHLDSWDVGQGAMDDGAGAFISWLALSVVKNLGFKPRRTMRSVLWTGEEFGLLGAQSYAKKHQNEMKKLILAMESDIGTFTPYGLTYSGKNKTSQCIMWEILQMMSPINSTRLTINPEGSDVQVFYEQNVPIASLDTANEKYFYFHHTDGDTMTVENSKELDKCLAVWTSVAYVLASMERPLPR